MQQQQQQQQPPYEPGHFRTPSGALRVAGLQHGSGYEGFHPMPPQWSGMREPGMNPTLGSESPGSDYAVDFMRDAPLSLILRIEQDFDPQLPVVTNTIYKAERDLVE